MLLKTEWVERFIQACAKVRSARRRSLAAGQLVYSTMPEGRCWVVGRVRQAARPSRRRQSLHPADPGPRRPLRRSAVRGEGVPRVRLAPARAGRRPRPRGGHRTGSPELEAAAHAQAELATLLLESVTTRAQFLERRLLWQFTTPIRARVAATLRDLICFEGQRCRHGHTIDVRLSHQDLAELVGAARPVVSAELVQMRREGLVEYTRCYFCVDDLAGLDRVAAG